jgi:hypothetical protein
MTIGAIDESQRKAATVVGFSYLIALPPAIFAEFYVRSHLIDFDNAAKTAQNIMTHERLFRLGIASNLTVFAVDVVLIMALYVVLIPVNRSLALLATWMGADRDRNLGRGHAQRPRSFADTEWCGLPACIRSGPVAGPGEAFRERACRYV